ncbi:fungal-specific transcription factor domain-containing protein [Nemania serpens]|nr:fungal-specific transcription factor domain-containing protein [Nemania serpens]
MAGFITEETVEGLEVDISNQENVSRRPGTQGRGSKQHIRHRASIACVSCRDRRIRCVVPKGGSGCIQCKRSGTECVIKMDDERRRPISKAYVSSLSARISLLESMLQQNGIAIPPAAHPPITKHEMPSAGSGDERRITAINARGRLKSDTSSPNRHVLSPPYSHEDFTMYEGAMEDLVHTDMLQSGQNLFHKEDSQFQSPDLQQEGALNRLFFPNGGSFYDQLSAKLELLDPTANRHVYSESPSRSNSKEAPENLRRAERIIRSLTPKTHDYLMQNFWKYHNSILQVIDKAAFEASKGSENPKYYSSFLHVIILAVGWRYANKDRCDIARMNLGNHESTIHREARHMLDIELERPLGIPSIQALLLLGDLECGVGRDNTGWMYAGMANHLAFSIGLHVDCSNVGLSNQEVSIRQRVMRACVLYDRHWALFLRRPMGIHSRDVDLDILRAPSSSPTSSKGNRRIPTNIPTVEEEIHELLVELMDLACRILEGRYEVKPNQGAKQVASDISILDQQLRDWHARLPSHLTWGPENIETAPYSYFLLHEHYHAAIILLHPSREADRLSSNEKSTSNSPPSPPEAEEVPGPLAGNFFSANGQDMGLDGLPSFVADSHSKSARGICAQAAIQFTQIVSQVKKKYDLEKVCCTSLQPAGTASIALLDAMADSKDEAEKQLYSSSLEIVTDAIHCMSRSYQPAAIMGNLIQTVLAQQHAGPRYYQLDHRDLFEQRVDGCKDARTPQYDNPATFPLLAGRHIHYDGDQSAQDSNHTYAASAQVGSQPSRPARPFYTPPNPSCTPNPFNHRFNSMPGPLSTISNGTDPSFRLDSLYGASIGVDSMYAIRSSSDNYLRIAPSAKGWGLHSLHAISQPEPNFDSSMQDWVSESASLGGTTALYQPGQNAVLGSNLDPELENQALTGCKREDTDSLAWMDSETRLAALTPLSPKGFMQSHGKTELGHEGRNLAAPHPNHELDFLTL